MSDQPSSPRDRFMELACILEEPRIALLWDDGMERSLTVEEQATVCMALRDASKSARSEKGTIAAAQVPDQSGPVPTQVATPASAAPDDKSQTPRTDLRIEIRDQSNSAPENK